MITYYSYYCCYSEFTPRSRRGYGGIILDSVKRIAQVLHILNMLLMFNLLICILIIRITYYHDCPVLGASADKLGDYQGPPRAPSAHGCIIARRTQNKTNTISYPPANMTWTKHLSNCRVIW